MSIKIGYGKGTSHWGPGVSIQLDADDLAEAVLQGLKKKGITVSGPRTVFVNGARCRNAEVYVDPAGWASAHGAYYSGRGPETKPVEVKEPKLPTKTATIYRGQAYNKSFVGIVHKGKFVDWQGAVCAAWYAEDVVIEYKRRAKLMGFTHVKFTGDWGDTKPKGGKL